MKSFDQRISDLAFEIRKSIKAILENNDLSMLDIGEETMQTILYWKDDDGLACLGPVERVILDNHGLSLVAHYDLDRTVQYEGDETLKNPVFLLSLRKTILAELENLHSPICHECGKPMVQGYCIDGGCEYYCSDECLHKHYTLKEWEKMYDNGNSNSYWTEWED